MKLKAGFTLAEMAIVITVIALIIGGVLAGRSLLRTSQLQSVLTDVEFYKSATKTFRIKYNYLPGDMPTAESFWGSDTACPNTVGNTAKKTATCSGDGNGQITGTETYRWAQHLADAGMIPGSYVGARDSSNAWIPGYIAPAGKIPGSLFYTAYQGANSTTLASFFSGDFGHIVVFEDANGAGAITPEEARSLDIKADDGLPGTGLIYGYLLTTCVTSYTNASATYNIASTGTGCDLVFKTGF